MSYLDRAFQMLWEWLAGYSLEAARTMTIPLFALAATILTAVLIRRVLPFAIKMFGIPALILIIAFAGTLVLGWQLGLARLWRLFGARPPSIVYAAGDWTIAVLSRTQRVRSALAPSLSRLETFSFGLLLIAVTALLWRWNVTYCDRAAATSCTGPIDDSYRALADFWAGTRL